MSREIKFRAWNPNSNRFDSYAGDIHMSLGEAGALWSKNIPMEFQQYTGLKDKNGVDIYEGDVVAIDMWHGNEHGYIPEDGLVKWYQPSSAFKWFSLEEDPADGNNYWLSQADEHQREVIGNIYENPELLA